MTIKDEYGQYSFTWISKDKLGLDSLDLPFKQVYGICFNDKGEILTIKAGNGDFKLPGGTPENGEGAVETLAREFYEEVTTVVEQPEYIGASLVEFTEGADPRSGLKRFYQLRFICRIKEMHELQPDPDNGKIHERYFIPYQEITQHVRWGNTGDQMFKEAIEMAEELGWI